MTMLLSTSFETSSERVRNIVEIFVRLVKGKEVCLQIFLGGGVALAYLIPYFRTECKDKQDQC